MGELRTESDDMLAARLAAIEAKQAEAKRKAVAEQLTPAWDDTLDLRQYASRYRNPVHVRACLSIAFRNPQTLGCHVQRWQRNAPHLFALAPQRAEPEPRLSRHEREQIRGRRYR